MEIRNTQKILISHQRKAAASEKICIVPSLNQMTEQCMYFDNNFPNFAYKIHTTMQMQCTDQGEYARNNLENFSQTNKRQGTLHLWEKFE